MSQRSISEIMAEGQKLTLEQVELLRKQINGTLSTEEATRLATLSSYLLGLVGEAQAQGVGTAVGTGYGEVQDEEDGDLYLDADLDDEVQPDTPRNPFGGYRWYRW